MEVDRGGGLQVNGTAGGPVRSIACCLANYSLSRSGGNIKELSTAKDDIDARLDSVPRIAELVLVRAALNLVMV